MTLAIYSGRPDPVWTIHSDHESFDKVKGHLHNVRTKGITYRHENMPATLGYKGFLVHHPEDEQAALIVGRETVAFQKLLLDTMPEGLMSETLRQKIWEEIDSGAVSPNMLGKSQTAPRDDITQVPTIVRSEIILFFLSI